MVLIKMGEEMKKLTLGFVLLLISSVNLAYARLSTDLEIQYVDGKKFTLLFKLYNGGMPGQYSSIVRDEHGDYYLQWFDNDNSPMYSNLSNYQTFELSKNKLQQKTQADLTAAQAQAGLTANVTLKDVVDDLTKQTKKSVDLANKILDSHAPEYLQVYLGTASEDHCQKHKECF